MKGKNNVDPARFVDFYSSKGWMVGKNKMKDWKAAVRNWENSNKAIYGTKTNIGGAKAANQNEDLFCGVSD